VDERGHLGRSGRLEDAPAALDVDPLGEAFVAARLDCPGEVDDRVGAVEDRLQRVLHHVGADPLDLRHLHLRHAAGDADDLGHCRLGAQRFEHAGADVAGRSSDDDAHGQAPFGWITNLIAPSSFFWNVS
jgi:hypothetical protein